MNPLAPRAPWARPTPRSEGAQRAYVAMLEAGLIPAAIVDGDPSDRVAVTVYHPAFAAGRAYLTWAMLRDPDLTACELRDLFARLAREGAIDGR